MRAWLTVWALLLSVLSFQAAAQSTLMPDTTPRVPPQPGQGLPLEDQRFLARAANLSEAEMEAARLAAEKSQNDAIKQLAAQLAADHEKARREIEQLARKSQVAIQPHPSRQAWRAELQRIGRLSGPEFDREFLDWQLQAHLVLVNLYQTQASNTPETDLAKFAIVELNTIQNRFDRAKKLGAQFGLAVDTIKQPPQY